MLMTGITDVKIKKAERGEGGEELRQVSTP